MQKGDFLGIFRAMGGRPVTIRLLDPPLHEFLPHTEAELATLAGKMGISVEQLRAKCDAIREVNPMLGHRGCRLGITFPEIYRMQVRAIIEAACELVREGQRVVPEIMVPLVGMALQNGQPENGVGTVPSFLPRLPRLGIVLLDPGAPTPAGRRDELACQFPTASPSSHAVVGVGRKATAIVHSRNQATLI